MSFKLVQDKSDSDDHPNSYYPASCNRSVELTPLDGSRRADVCIIGGGYTGLSSALHLAERGYDAKMGARPMSRIIQEHIKRPLAEELLFGSLADGGHVRIMVGADDTLQLNAEPVLKELEHLPK